MRPVAGRLTSRLLKHLFGSQTSALGDQKFKGLKICHVPVSIRWQPKFNHHGLSWFGEKQFYAGRRVLPGQL